MDLFVENFGHGEVIFVVECMLLIVSGLPHGVILQCIIVVWLSRGRTLLFIDLWSIVILLFSFT